MEFDGTAEGLFKEDLAGWCQGGFEQFLAWPMTFEPSLYILELLVHLNRQL